MLTRRAFGASVTACASVGSAATPTMRALLVGVTEYPGLAPSLQLKGPRNDVEQLVAVLSGRGFQPANLTVLADGIGMSKALPTRAAILRELDALESKTARGDFVLIYLAGHGSRQPVPPNAPDEQFEADGIQEVFLPRDVSSLNSSEAMPRIENALGRHELVGSIDRLRSRGAFVWVVIDACHSGRMVRGSVADDVIFRNVEPGVFGITEAHLEAARAAATRRIRTRGQVTTPGGSPAAVYFYACERDQAAGEYVLPPGTRMSTGKRFGAFSYTLIQALELRVPLTYRQLAQHVLTQFGALQITLQTPTFGGDALDAPVLFQSNASPARWPIQIKSGEAFLHAGLLNGVAQGAIVALLPGSLAQASEVKGYAKVIDAEPANCRLEPVVFEGAPAQPVGLWTDGLYGLQVRPGVPLGLTVSLRIEPSAQGARGATMRGALERLRSNSSAIANIRWVEAPQPGDVTLVVEADRANLISRGRASLPGQGEPLLTAVKRLDGRASVDDAASELSGNLLRVSRSNNLLKMAAALAANSNFSSLGLQVDMQILSKDASPAKRALHVGDVPVLRGRNNKLGDRIDGVLHNKSSVPIDVTVLYIDSQYGIALIWPDRADDRARVPAGSVQPFSIDIDDGTFGIERILLIAIRPRRKDANNSLAFLAQPSLELARGYDSEDASAFAHRAFAEIATRGPGEPHRMPSSGTAMEVYTVAVRQL